MSGLYTGDGQGSSPHTRGAQSPQLFDGGRQRIIPAYAGSTKPNSPASGARADHPRIRGEHLHHLVWAVFVEGSSPHTRGAHHDGDVI